MKDLEADHVPARTDYKEVPPRVGYALTPLGRSLVDATVPVCAHLGNRKHGGNDFPQLQHSVLDPFPDQLVTPRTTFSNSSGKSCFGSTISSMMRQSAWSRSVRARSRSPVVCTRIPL